MIILVAVRKWIEVVGKRNRLTIWRLLRWSWQERMVVQREWWWQEYNNYYYCYGLSFAPESHVSNAQYLRI